MTAVEWLIDQIINNNGVNHKIFEQAKQMEAEQSKAIPEAIPEMIDRVKNFGKKLQENIRTDEPLVLNDFNNKEFYITEFGNDKEMSFIIGIENAYVNLTKEDAIKIKNFIDKQLKRKRNNNK